MFSGSLLRGDLHRDRVFSRTRVSHRRVDLEYFNASPFRLEDESAIRGCTIVSPRRVIFARKQKIVVELIEMNSIVLPRKMGGKLSVPVRGTTTVKHCDVDASNDLDQTSLLQVQ